MQNNPVKHIPKHQLPVGSVKSGKKKIKDGTTGKVSWRQGLSGFVRDTDGDAIAKNPDRAGLKKRPKHTPHKSYRPHKGDRPGGDE